MLAAPPTHLRINLKFSFPYFQSGTGRDNVTSFTGSAMFKVCWSGRAVIK